MYSALPIGPSVWRTAAWIHHTFFTLHKECIQLFPLGPQSGILLHEYTIPSLLCTRNVFSSSRWALSLAYCCMNTPYLPYCAQGMYSALHVGPSVWRTAAWIHHTFLTVHKECIQLFLLGPQSGVLLHESASVPAVGDTPVHHYPPPFPPYHHHPSFSSSSSSPSPLPPLPPLITLDVWFRLPWKTVITVIITITSTNTTVHSL